MRLLRIPLSALIVILLSTSTGMSSAQPAGDCDELRGDEKILPGELIPGAGSRWKRQELLDKGDLQRTLSDLDYQDELPLILSLDLNGDGKQELLLTSSEGKLCGNAGCPYALLAPASMTRIGEFFGHMAVLDEYINGYRIIQTYGRYRVSDTSLDTYVYDDKVYRLVSHAILDRCGLEQWRRRMRTPKEPGR